MRSTLIGLLAHKVVLPAAAFLAVAASAGAEGDSTNRVTLEEIGRALSSADTVFAQFEQKRNVSLFNEPLRSEGFLCFAKPQSIRWEITSPHRSILISDGRGVAQFEWANDRWQKLDVGLAEVMKQVTGQITMILQGRFATRAAGDAYAVSLAVTNGVVVTLAPRQKASAEMISSISIHVSADLREVRKVVLTEPDGDSTEIGFLSEKVNLSFPSATFDFRAPGDIEEVRRSVASQPGVSPSAVSLPAVPADRSGQ